MARRQAPRGPAGGQHRTRETAAPGRRGNADEAAPGRRRPILSPMAARTDKVVVEVAGREVAISNPGKVYFPEAGITKLELVQYYLAVAEGGAARRGRAAERAGALRGRHPRRVLLPEARTRGAAAVDRGGRAALPVRPRGRGGRAQRRRGARLDGQPRLPRAAPAPGPRRRPRAPGRAAGRPRPDARHRVAADPGRGARRAGGAGRLRPHRLAEDLGLARRARQRAAPSPLVVQRGAAGGAGARARGRAPRACARHQQVVEGGAPRRLPRLQPEREGPHGGERVLGAAQARRTRLGARDLGGAVRGAARGVHAAHDAGALRRDRRPARRDRRAPVLARAAARAVSARQEAEGLGDAPWPPHYAKQEGEPPRVAPSRRRSEATPRAAGVPAKPLVEIGRADEEGRGAGRARPLEGAPRQGGRVPRAGRRAGRRDARPLFDLDPHARQPRARARAAAARAGATRPRRRPVAPPRGSRGPGRE